MYIIVMSDKEAEAAKVLCGNFGRAAAAMINVDSRMERVDKLAACDNAAALAVAMFAALMVRVEKAPAFIERWTERQRKTGD